MFPYHVIRLQVFSAIVFSCMLSSGEQEHCYDYNKSECDYGITVGAIAFLGITGFLVLDALFDNISSVQRRLHIVIADIAFSGTPLAVERILHLLKLKCMQYSAIHTNYMISHSTTLQYNHNI